MHDSGFEQERPAIEKSRTIEIMVRLFLTGTRGSLPFVPFVSNCPKALQAALPSLDGLPSDLAQELAELEVLDNQALRQVLLETVPLDQQQALGTSLQRNQVGELTQAEREQLAALQRAADRVMLRKARAAVLLRFRGQRIPILAELRQLTLTPR